jgi:hypothetical protein
VTFRRYGITMIGAPIPCALNGGGAVLGVVRPNPGRWSSRRSTLARTTKGSGRGNNARVQDAKIREIVARERAKREQA